MMHLNFWQLPGYVVRRLFVLDTLTPDPVSLPKQLS
jgi:hypothetical protein